jgi:hypothetical protein
MRLQLAYDWCVHGEHRDIDPAVLEPRDLLPGLVVGAHENSAGERP